MEYENGNVSSKHLTRFEVTSTEVDPLTQCEDSVSSSASSSSSQELIVLTKDVLNNSLYKSKQAGLESKEPISSTSSQASGQHSFTSMQGGSTTQFPHPQLMGFAGYDPNRIPLSAFASKSTTPMDWSVASNESLFSIQMGNGSFSRDHVYMLYRSGELSKLDEAMIVPSTLPPVAESENMSMKSVSSTDKESEVTEEAAETPKKALEEPAETLEKALKEPAEDLSKEKLSPVEEVRNSITISISLRSDGSTNSTQSFAFPVLGSEVGRNSSVKVDIENLPSPKQMPEQPKEQPLPQNPEATPNPAMAGWFSCFSCFSCCSLRCLRVL